MSRSTELLRDIHEINLMYLLLLQRVARSGETAAVGLAMSADASRWLAELRPDELIKLARSNILIGQLNVAPHILLTALSQGMEMILATPPVAAGWDPPAQAWRTPTP